MQEQPHTVNIRNLHPVLNLQLICYLWLCVVLRLPDAPDHSPSELIMPPRGNHRPGHTAQPCAGHHGSTGSACGNPTNNNGGGKSTRNPDTGSSTSSEHARRWASLVRELRQHLLHHKDHFLLWESDLASLGLTAQSLTSHFFCKACLESQCSMKQHLQVPALPSPAH